MTPSGEFPAPAEPADRARAIIDGLGEGFLSVDADWRLTDCNPAAERFFRRSRDEILGLKLWNLTGLSDESPFATLGHRVAETRRVAEAELEYRAKGRQRTLFIRAFPLASGIAAVWRDVTRARVIERRAARNAARYMEVADGVPAAAWMSRADGKLEFINAAMAETLGWPPAELLGDGWMAALDPDHKAGLLLARSQARAAHAPFRYEARFRRKDGTPRILQLFGRPRFSGSGAFRGHLGICNDVTEVREAEKRQRVLVNELNHRVKNVLTTVQSLVRQTLREHGVDRLVEDEIVERLMALAAAHDVLTRGDWKGADLFDVAVEATKAYNHAHRIALAGPRVRIAPNTAIALSMAFHELATNALKHGALSVADGRVELFWDRDGDGVDLTWREHGGPPVVKPKRSGFGSRLLGRVLAGELGAPADLVYPPEGLVCTIRAPAAALSPAAGIG
jgi:PAS domain S-box-containing protein